MTEADAAVLKAEVVALQAVLISVFRRMVSDRSELAPLFCQAFDEAETILSGVAEKLGLEAPLETTVGALRIVEEIRRGVIRDPTVCSDG
jgi:hypothetical protein